MKLQTASITHIIALLALVVKVENRACPTSSAGCEGGHRSSREFVDSEIKLIEPSVVAATADANGILLIKTLSGEYKVPLKRMSGLVSINLQINKSY